MEKLNTLYDGATQKKLPDFVPDTKKDDPKLYKPSEGLQQVVNLAIALGKPLLLTGEPGTGKTQLANNIAYTFGLDKPLVFNTRSNSQARDLFYFYDAVGHFHHTQMHKEELGLDLVEEKFIRYKAFGEAILAQKRMVVLIDEIDKAPRDFPNDILNIIEDMSFEVPEIDKTHRLENPAYRPVVILTSNTEKNLPDAFLRRCLFFHLDFPSDEELMEIVVSKTSGDIYEEEQIKEFVLPHFRNVRATLVKKKPATSEFIYWVDVLEKLTFPPEKLALGADLTQNEKKNLELSYSVLAKNKEDLALLKR